MDHVIRRWRIPKDFDPVLALVLGFDDSRFNPGSIKFGKYGPKCSILRVLFWYHRLGWVPHVNNGTKPNSQPNRGYQNRPLKLMAMITISDLLSSPLLLICFGAIQS
ncbi:hypothetical protein AVEN_191309-1 [Araneus ventricosus]|uniref:Uncharacterized protein n=1 Tax=Araneus ventricosus TaxID=182803 RepID=A0A4Y2VIZ2_ARAVE|nr:hypothetical protein AVEN_191309-1 [Araneus ventricosus]